MSVREVHLTIDGLVKALKMLRANQCANIEAEKRRQRRQSGLKWIEVD
jgi:hypothetical protein